MAFEVPAQVVRLVAENDKAGGSLVSGSTNRLTPEFKPSNTSNLYIFALPLLDFKEVYGPFAISVSLMFWAFISGLLLLGGAHLSAAGQMERN